MWTIRQEQTEAFRQHHLQKFEDAMVEHLKKFAPKHWEVIGEPTGRRAIQLGIKHAEKYGFTNKGPVRFYIELMFMFGSYFDTDPQCPWAIEILNDPASLDQMARADRLHAAVTKYWDSVAGPKNRYIFEALRKLSEARADDYIDGRAALDDALVAGLRDIYPQKCEYLGERPVRMLLKRTLEICESHGFSSNEDLALMTGLTFFLGHGCTLDPLHGWIGRRLKDKRFDTVQKRSTELRTKAMLYLKHTLEGNEAA